jgi:hypothetical protein
MVWRKVRTGSLADEQDTWKLHPEFEAPAKVAISGLFRPGAIKGKDMLLVREILKQVGALCARQKCRTWFEDEK